METAESPEKTSCARLLEAEITKLKKNHDTMSKTLPSAERELKLRELYALRCAFEELTILIDDQKIDRIQLTHDQFAIVQLTIAQSIMVNPDLTVAAEFRLKHAELMTVATYINSLSD